MNGSRSLWLGLLGTGFLLVGGAWPGGAAAAAETMDDPCTRLFVPEGTEITCTVERQSTDPADWLVSVHPLEGTFSGLSELSLRPLAEPVDDPEQWLKEQVQIDVSHVDGALASLLDDPDNPFSGESWWQSLQGLKDVVHSFAGLPLQACEEPEITSGGDHEIDCDWGFGGLRQYLTVRLVERDGEPYALRIQAMNDRRFRHLTAIANSF